MKRTERFIEITESMKMHAQEFDNCSFSLIFIDAFCSLLNGLSDREQDEFFEKSPEIKELCLKWDFVKPFIKSATYKRWNVV